MEYRYYVAYREPNGRFVKKLVTAYSDWYGCINDITVACGCSVGDIVSIAIDTNPPAEES